jgi:tetratricopeptide (TPR) repeat protein
MNPEFTDAFNNTGNCYAALQISDSAKIHFEKVLQIDPSNKKATYNLGITYKILGDSVTGQRYINKASEMQ